ncbi:response regulator [Polaribacter sp. Hel_I_88]|uniref:response regulator n=1 Tax=Polaribacter sp. Hel_I_88 TaxID=1250006 RepID=UPI0004799C5C|nr:response regulator [Polaribacter sp. Hel_I_88]
MATTKHNLLLIEDDFCIGEKLYNSTKDLKNIHTVHLAVNLQEAKTRLMQTNYNVIVLDLNLPDGNGIELLKWLREKNKLVKVFVFSINIELKRMCLKNGADAFFDKSQDFDLLISEISNSLSL